MKKVDLLLINPPFHKRNGSGTIFPLGLGYIISAVEKKGFVCAVIDCSRIISTYKDDDLCILKKTLIYELEKYSPGLIGIGPCITTQVKALKIVAECCLETFGSEYIFAGGPLASIDGQEWFFFDFLKLKYIVKGDGEEAICKMLETFKRGESLQNCVNVTRKGYSFYNEIENINELDFPNRPFIEEDVISTRRSYGSLVKTATMITSRGCIYSCKYCVSGNLKYKRFRKRNYNDIINEMQYLNDKYQVTDIIFYDDCFFYDSENVHQDINRFCSLLLERELGLTWQMEMRCDLFLKLRSEDMKILEQSGCRQVNLGIEKTYIAGLKNLGKNIPLNGLAEQIFSLKKETKIKVAGTFILGGKNETEKEIVSIIENSRELNLDFAHYNPLFIYPGTPLYGEYFKNKRDWVDYIINDYWPWGEIVYENEYVNREKLLELVNSAYEIFYADSQYKVETMVKDRFNLGEIGGENENI